MADTINARVALEVLGLSIEALSELERVDDTLKSNIDISTDAIYVSGQSAHIGPQISISDRGALLSYSLARRLEQTRSLIFVEFDEDGNTTREARVPKLSTPIKTSLQSISTEELATSIKFTQTVTLENDSMAMKEAHLYFGNIVPPNITISAYADTEDENHRIFTGIVDTSTASPNSEFMIEGLPIIGLYKEEGLILTVESASPFNLKGNTSGNFYVALSVSEVIFNNITNESNIVNQIESKTGDDRLNIFSLENKADRMNAKLSTNLVLDDVGKIIPFDVCDFCIGVSNTAGVFEITGNPGLYNGFLRLWIYESSDPWIYTWIEWCPVSTGVWTIYPDSLDKSRIPSDTGNNVKLDGGIPLHTGDKFRIMMKRSSGDVAELRSQSLIVPLGTVVQPSAAISFIRVGDLI